MSTGRTYVVRVVGSMECCTLLSSKTVKNYHYRSLPITTNIFETKTTEMGE